MCVFEECEASFISHSLQFVSGTCDSIYLNAFIQQIEYNQHVRDAQDLILYSVLDDD